MQPANLHTFHIPVMGLAFSIDSPVKVARYGISSVLSLNDDILIEQMRQYYSAIIEEPFIPIGTDQEEFRARRITAYLNLIDKLVTAQTERLRQQPFAPDTEITKYFDLLPDYSPTKVQYEQ